MKHRWAAWLLVSCVLAAAILALILYPLLGTSRLPESHLCRNNLRRLSTATSWYLETHQDHFPPVRNWNDVLKRQRAKVSGSSEGLDKQFICPSAEDRTKPSYAMNDRLDGLRVGDIQDTPNTVCYFESIPGHNLHGGPELLPPKPRHSGEYTVCFVDGHVESVAKSEIGKLNWDPAKRPPPATE